MIAPQSPTLQVFILPAGLRGRTAASVREEPAGGPTSRGLEHSSARRCRTRQASGRVPSGATRTAAIGCWIWCAGGPTRATSRDCCSIPRRRTATGSASGSARIRGRPARARRFTWSAPEPIVRRLTAGGEWIRTDIGALAPVQSSTIRSIRVIFPHGHDNSDRLVRLDI